MSQPAVSVIVPCYNGGRFLDQMLASLDAQTFRDFEVVIVDDGSTDAETVRKLESLSAAIRIVRQSNLGLAAARNAGFREAKANLVLPLDCDDALSPTFLAETVASLYVAPPSTAFAFTDMWATGSLGGTLPRHFNRFDQLFVNRLPYCLLLRKSAWEAAGGYDNEMRDGYEDWEFNIRLVLAGFRGIGIRRPLFFYHVSPSGMLMSRSAQLHGKLWRYIMEKHRNTYNWRSLYCLRRNWSDENPRFGTLSALVFVWGGTLLPHRFVSLTFYISLRLIHWWRVRRGILTSGRATSAPHKN